MIKSGDGLSEEELSAEIARLTEILERERVANITNRAIYRWYLDFLRNCMVVAALYYLAEKSGSWWLYGITISAWGALGGFCYTYIENAWPWHKLASKKGRFKRSMSILASALLLQLVLLGVTVSLMLSLNKIVQVQVSTTKSP